MYTFADRSDRSLTLRPEATAPICRAYVEHGFQREPQPAKLFTIASDVPLRGAREGALPRALAGLGRGDRQRRPVGRRRAHPALRHAAPPARRDAVPPRAQLDRLPRVPARVPRALARSWLDGERSTGSTTRRARRPRRARCACSTTTRRSRRPSARRSTEAPKIGESLCADVPRALRRRAARSRRDGRRVPARADARPRARLLLADDVGVRRPARERERDALGRRPLRLPRRGDRRPADARRGLRRGDRAAAARARGGGRGRRTQRRHRRLLRARGRARRASSSRAGSPSSARPGVSADTDYAGRSLKGQLTQAGRLGAATTVVVDRRRATIRRPGSADEDVAHDELPARLSDELARPHVRRAAARARRADADPRRLGGTRRDHGGLVFVDLRDHTGVTQLVINPERSPVAAELAKEIRNEFVLRARGRGRRARARDRQRGDADRRGRAPGRRARDRLALDAAPVPARRGGRRRDAAPALPLARPAPRRSCSATCGCARRWSAIIRRTMEEAGFLDIQTPILFKPTPEGARDFLVPEPPPAGPLLRAAAVARRSSSSCCMIAGFDRYYQIAICFRDEDLRADRRAGVHAARRRDGVPRARGRARRAHEQMFARVLARVPRHRDSSTAVPAA